MIFSVLGTNIAKEKTNEAYKTQQQQKTEKKSLFKTK